MRYSDIQELEYYGSDGSQLVTDDDKDLVTEFIYYHRYQYNITSDNYVQNSSLFFIVQLSLISFVLQRDSLKLIEPQDA